MNLLQHAVKMKHDLLVSDEITRPVADPFTFLMEDHRRIQDCLEELAHTTEDQVGRREEIFETVQSGLLQHSEMEEAYLYPKLCLVDALRETVNESYEEHALVEGLLKDLGDLDKSTEEWTAKFTVLKENVEHHVMEEEAELFPRARKAMAGKDQDELAAQFEEYLRDSE